MDRDGSASCSKPTKLVGSPRLVAAQPLTRAPGVPIHCGVSRLDGRSGEHRKVAGEESPGSMDMRCRITTGGREPRESATESRPPRPTWLSGLPDGQEGGAVRVKGCGKSAPRLRQRGRHGKPHREQDRIGTARRLFLRKPEDPRDRCPDPAVRVGCSRRQATGVPEEWPSRVRFAARPTEPGLQAG
jgi:hypothetical protein